MSIKPDKDFEEYYLDGLCRYMEKDLKEIDSLIEWIENPPTGVLLALRMINESKGNRCG